MDFGIHETWAQLLPNIRKNTDFSNVKIYNFGIKNSKKKQDEKSTDFTNLEEKNEEFLLVFAWFDLKSKTKFDKNITLFQILVT